MQHLTPMSHAGLDQVSAAIAYSSLSHSVAPDASFVQGGGGNVSVKFTEGIHIKASGTRLDESTPNCGFVTLGLNDARTKLKLGGELVEAFTASSLSGRPSIETPLHIMCHGTFVAHVHSVGAVSIGLVKNFKEICAQNNWIAIEYVEPGQPLLNALMETSFQYESEGCAILRNHGLLVWSNDLNKCIDLLVNAEQRCRSVFLKAVTNFRDPSQDLMSSEISYTSVNFNSTIDEGWFEYISDHVLVPDQAVFLSNVDLRSLQIKKNVIKVDGLTKTQVEIIHLLWLIGHLLSMGECTSLIPLSEIERILKLETEKYRQEVSK